MLLVFGDKIDCQKHLAGSRICVCFHSDLKLFIGRNLNSFKMKHIAIMKKSWGLTEKILDGRKVIESRWMKNRSAPWHRISAGDVVYFKNSGEPVRMRASVSGVVYIENLTPRTVAAVLHKYGRRDGIDRRDAPKFRRLFENKKYCTLVFLRGARPVRPFGIRKRGFGAMAAWLCVGSLRSIKP